jgi:RNA polymerase sigma-70 factor (ECF subfamily)
MSRKRLSESEFVLLITSHQAAIYAYVLTLLPDRVAAQDILQETNLVLCRKRDEFEPGTNFKAWAFSIAYWQTMAHLKRAGTRRTRSRGATRRFRGSPSCPQIMPAKTAGG